jgi:hypothetical protein
VLPLMSTNSTVQVWGLPDMVLVAPP